MAVGHTLSGLATGLATVPLFPHAGPGTGLAWTATIAASALLPDLDVGGSRAGRMWGPLTRGLRVRIWGRSRTLVPGAADIIGVLAGGHRQGTHSVLGLAVLLALAWAAQWSRVGTGILIAVLTGLTLTVIGVLWPGRQTIEWWPANLAVSVLTAVAAARHGVDLPGWMPVAVAAGAAVHIAGDMITVHGCPLSWPTGTRRVSLAPMEVGGRVERYLVTPALAAAVVLLAAHHVGLDLLGALTNTWRAT